MQIKSKQAKYPNIICQEAIQKTIQTLDCKQVARKCLSCFTLVPFMESLTKSVYDIVQETGHYNYYESEILRKNK
jgi:hypothetical protein